MLDTLARFQFFIYPLVVHLSVVYQVPFITACLLPLFYFILAQPFINKKKLITIKSGIFLLLCLVALFSYYSIDHSVIYLPPILMMSLILYPFIRSVLPGKTPLLSRFYQLTEKENNLQAMQYTGKVTWVWVVFIALLLINTLILTFFAPLEIWSLFTNFINYILMLALFIAEWLFRMLWFKQWVSPVKFVQQLMTVDQRELLR
jgi:uncharacterized membrane protein